MKIKKTWARFYIQSEGLDVLKNWPPDLHCSSSEARQANLWAAFEERNQIIGEEEREEGLREWCEGWSWATLSEEEKEVWQRKKLKVREAFGKQMKIVKNDHKLSFSVKRRLRLRSLSNIDDKKNQKAQKMFSSWTKITSAVLNWPDIKCKELSKSEMGKLVNFWRPGLFLVGLFSFISANQHVLLDTTKEAMLDWTRYPYGPNSPTPGWVEESFTNFEKSINWRSYVVCDVSYNNVNNWLWTPFITRGSANRLYIELKFSLRNCDLFPGNAVQCKETFSLLYYEFDAATREPPPWEPESYKLIDQVKYFDS